MSLQNLPISYRKWKQDYNSAKRNAYRTVGRGKPFSSSRMRLANDLREIRAGKRYKFAD